MRKLYRLIPKLVGITCFILIYLASRSFKMADHQIMDTKYVTSYYDKANLLLSRPEVHGGGTSLQQGQTLNNLTSNDSALVQYGDNKQFTHVLQQKNNEHLNKLMKAQPEGPGAKATDIRQVASAGDGNTTRGGNKVVAAVGSLNTVDEDVQFPSFVEYSDTNGLGEYGRKAELFNLTSEQKEESDHLFQLNYFNQYLSDRISVHRRLPGSRNPRCKSDFPPGLPTASVIICFHNEAWSVLLRSVHSVLDRSPPNLLREIILVDDLSTMSHLKRPLDKYWSPFPKVKIVRSEKREGLIRSRLLGYSHAQGRVLVFLDAHIECFPGWLEPLIDVITDNPRTVPFPVINLISKDTFHVTAKSGVTSVGTLDWAGLIFSWSVIKPPPEEKAGDPVRSPTMPGGLFAVDRDYFTQLGTYDPGLDFWGGENMELSFKVWMCNGSIVIHPCSQVGHIFRNTNPILWPQSNPLTRNSMRVAEVWMDEFKDTFLDYSPEVKEIGDLSGRKKLRASLHCRDFRWYYDYVIGDTAPLPQVKVIARGEIKSMVGDLCLDSAGRARKVGLFACHGLGGNQWWQEISSGNIIQYKMVLCYQKGALRINGCNTDVLNWSLDRLTKIIQHIDSRLCLEVQLPRKLAMAACTGARNQQWILPDRKLGVA